MTQDIVTSYVTLLSQFFTLSSSTHTSQAASTSGDASTSDAPGIPDFVPASSNMPTICHWLLKILNEITECANEVGALELAGEASASLKELVASARWRFEEATCAAWVRGRSYVSTRRSEYDD
jgi:exocyst complex component 2